ncbi:MAG: hypothetical protein C0631_15035 [Sedimenticola sp.]|nr:MAG: hypothetical protein C0631_15035 [Sedimenticola sp.]
MKPIMRLMLALTGLFFVGNVFAGDSGTIEITYSPAAATAVPTLSDFMLIITGLLMAGIAFRLIRNTSGGSPLASIVALALLGATMIPGYDFLKTAYAQAAGLSNPAGGVLNIPVPNPPTDNIQVDNTSGVPQRINDIRYVPDGNTSCQLDTPSTTPECTIGMILPNTSTCYVAVICGDV